MRRTGRWTRTAIVVAALCAATAVARADQGAIVVFGAAVASDGEPGPLLRSRLEATLEHARARPDDLVVVTGGAVANEHGEADVMARWLVQHGVAPTRIRVEPRARNTRENADLVLPILQQERIDRVTVVTQRFHTARARFHMRAALGEAGQAGVRVETVGVDDGLRGLQRLRVFTRERLKILRDASFRRRDRAGWSRPGHGSRATTRVRGPR